MTDEERLMKEKAAIASLKGGQSAITTALERIKRLEDGLLSAKNTINHLKGYIAPDVYCYTTDNQPRNRKCTDVADKAVLTIEALL